MLIKALKEICHIVNLGSKNNKGNVIKKDKYWVWLFLGNP